MRTASLALALILGLAPTSPAAAPATAPNKPPIVAATPCDLGGALLREIVAAGGSRGVLYDAAPYLNAPVAASVRGNNAPSDVPAELVARWNEAGRGNLLIACPALAAALPTGVRLATEADRAAVAGAAHGPTLHFIGAPVLSADGERVLVQVGSRCASLCGAGFVRHFRKTARGWVELPYAGLWLS
jgi:hypothetical protein